MEKTDETIIYNLEITENGDSEMILQKTFNNLMAKLKKEFGDKYEISSDELTSADKDWSHEIKIRKGNKIGVMLYLKWEKTSPTILKIEVDESSKFGSIITYGIQIPFLIIGAYLGYNDMAPLAFLPGYKIAAALGGIIALIPGAILVYFIKTLLLKNEKEANNKLVTEVRKIVII